MLKRFLPILVPVLLIVSLPAAALAKPSSEPFEIIPNSFQFVPSNGAAAAHADWTTSFDFAHEADQQPDNDVRTIVVELPAGFDASNTAVPTCTQAQLIGNVGAGERTGVQCPAASQVGTISFDLYKGEHPENSPEKVTVPL